MAYPTPARESAPSSTRHLSDGGACAARVWRLRRGWDDLLRRIPCDCPLCGGRAAGNLLCGACLDDVLSARAAAPAHCAVCALSLRGRQCPDCAVLRPAFDRVIAAFDYAAPGDLLIRYMKNRHRHAHARTLADLLAGAVESAVPSLPRHTIMVPVPASRDALKRRGFNPAAEIARALARRLPYALRPELLRRTREGRRQARLPREQRLSSVEHLYACPTPVPGAVIAVVDDVLTTGSTLDSIARAFKAAGAASVAGLVVARTPYGEGR